jgi:hypothetical protein
LYLKSGDGGVTQVIIANGSLVGRERYVAATLNAPVGNLKLRTIRDGVAFVVTGLIGPDGTLYNETISERQSTARVFDKPAVRFVSIELPLLL